MNLQYKVEVIHNKLKMQDISVHLCFWSRC